MNKKSLLIVIDMLNGFAKEGKLSSSRINNIIPTIEDMLQNYEHNIFICDHHSEDDSEMKTYPIHCLANDKESQIVHELQEYVQKVYYKNTTNGFYDIPMKLWDQYDEFVLVGCCTDICVMQLALSLKIYLNKINSDKKVLVYSNATDTYDAPEHNGDKFHNFALDIMKNAGIKIRVWE
ncbi:isochorismatase family cysteine hydrolase [Mycoplasma sp. 21DD0573]|uniref:isochorismatase family cysteine hydrolase n=1 Tax=unclassified Mycoplasma TaxID=2683645 RepID=UPI002B1D6566|nr:isochorismatase family cysteine hydrolase [Mycoplasma sp. 21DD0573]MEA4276144.1 isochorismatase family cysteine hydrolase [Mycoplasma sp. 21DD0573]